MDERFAFLIATIVPIAAVGAWLIGLQRGIEPSIQFRYKVARNLFVFAIVAWPAIFVSSIVVYAGAFFGFLWLGIFLSALFSIPTSAILGLGNFILLKRIGPDSSPTKDY
jgi:hypothetical protein